MSKKDEKQINLNKTDPHDNYTSISKNGISDSYVKIKKDECIEKEEIKNKNIILI